MSQTLPAIIESEGMAPAISRRRVWMERTSTLAAMVAVLWFYHWSVDLQGGFERGRTDTYGLLVRGYLKGQLHLDAAPDPRLKTLADPYDPGQNAPFRLPDASYFNGRYYLYFGSVPALVLMAPYALVTGRELPTGAATFVFAAVGFLAACALWLGIRARWFPKSGWWIAPLGVLTLGFGTHVLALVRRPGMWEMSISAGFAFTMLALFAAHRALVGRRTLLALVVSGFCLGLAVGSRPTCLFGAALLLPPIWLAWRRPQRGAEWWRCALAGGIGLAVCGAAICAHNYARFGDPLEMGQRYQLSITKVASMRLYDLAYVAHNLRVYFFNRPDWTWEFPFVSANVANSNTPPGYYCTEEIVGIALSLPMLWLAWLAPFAARRQMRGEAAGLPAQLWSLAAALLPVLMFIAMFCAATERYMADFSPALALLALCGALTIERWAQSCRGGMAVPLGMGAVGVVTVLMGVLVSFDYHGRMLSRDQPKLWADFERASHHTLAQIGLWTGQLEGPRVLKVRFKSRPTGAVETFWRAADERVVIEHVSEKREVRFGYARGAAPVKWGRHLTWEPDHTHTVELQLPSLYDASQGLMRGLRSTEEFRERSCVVVRFSGGHALAEIVEPLASGSKRGGAIGEDFSGDVRSVRRRLFRANEFPLADAAPGPRGGTLQLRAMLAAPLAHNGEPLFAAGALYGSDILFVRDAGDGAVKFVFDHFEVLRHESAPLQLPPGSVHTIEITLPSCPVGDAFGRAASGEVTVRLNGVEVLRGNTPCHGFIPGNESIGANPFGTTCGRAFRGWLIEARWSGVTQP
jgi:hypothetical protein